MLDTLARQTEQEVDLSHQQPRSVRLDQSDFRGLLADEGIPQRLRHPLQRCGQPCLTISEHEGISVPRYGPAIKGLRIHGLIQVVVVEKLPGWRSTYEEVHLKPNRDLRPETGTGQRHYAYLV